MSKVTNSHRFCRGLRQWHCFVFSLNYKCKCIFLCLYMSYGVEIVSHMDAMSNVWSHFHFIAYKCIMCNWQKYWQKACGRRVFLRKSCTSPLCIALIIKKSCSTNLYWRFFPTKISFDQCAITVFLCKRITYILSLSFILVTMETEPKKTLFVLLNVIQLLSWQKTPSKENSFN